MVLLPEGLHALKKVAKEVGLDLRGAYLNLDGGFDSAHNRKCIFNAGLIPNIPENPRNRKRPKRGRKRFFNATIHALRMRVERTFAWEDKFKPTFKGVWSTAVNFVLLPLPDTKLGQYPPHDKRSDDSLGRHGLGGWAYCPRRSARASLA
jgi:hypothetical protein